MKEVFKYKNYLIKGYRGRVEMFESRKGFWYFVVVYEENKGLVFFLLGSSICEVMDGQKFLFQFVELLGGILLLGGQLLKFDVFVGDLI